MLSYYISVSKIAEALEILAQEGERARIVAGATDLLLEMERGIRKDINTLVDITRIPELDQIRIDSDDIIHIGASVTHNQCLASEIIRSNAPILTQACWQVGSPQIRNRGTIVGNLVTASPANDTIPALIALNASLTIVSLNGNKILPLSAFYLGVRKTVLESDELITEITFPSMKVEQRGIFLKFALRKAQAISLVNTAILLTLSKGMVKEAIITLGAVAPTVIHASEAEYFLVGKSLTQDVISETSKLARVSAQPISDIRSSFKYRSKIVEVILRRGLGSLSSTSDEDTTPVHPVLLCGNKPHNRNILNKKVSHSEFEPIETTINGRKHVFNNCHNKTLLRLLREDAHITGTKEGCAEGECGACTVYLDGMAVMSCMVPAARAHMSEITTIEGLSEGEALHPIQTAFIQEGAVQCGYCTPGIVMSTAKLLEERHSPTHDEIAQALTGNLCRCTGYYSIIRAVERAARQS